MMKKFLLILVICLLVGGAILFMTYSAQNICADSQRCYMCKGGGYVCYVGKDTFELRKQAKSKYACEVSGTSSCSSSQCKNRFVK